MWGMQMGAEASTVPCELSCKADYAAVGKHSVNGPGFPTSALLLGSFFYCEE